MVRLLLLVMMLCLSGPVQAQKRIALSFDDTPRPFGVLLTLPERRAQLIAAFYIEDIVAALRRDGWKIVSADEAYRDPIGAALPDVPSTQGTITELMAWGKGLPAPRWYKYNNAKLMREDFRASVLTSVLKGDVP